MGSNPTSPNIRENNAVNILDLLTYSQDLGNGTEEFSRSIPINEINYKDGYQYNPNDGNWYASPPAPDYNDYSWDVPAPPDIGRDLARRRNSDISYNREVAIRRKINEEYGIDLPEADYDGPRKFSDFLNEIARKMANSIEDGAEAWGKELSRDIENIRRDMIRTWEEIRQSWEDAMNWIPPPRDPLALDLDGDGIETLAADGYYGALFDNDADGIQTATGWVAPDDGLLVLDRNGNGMIDDGSELFGDATPTTNGTAASGFAALAEMDSTADGVVNASDSEFANLRVWRDANSDGISQAGELFTLDELGIVSLDTQSTATNTDLGDGNRILREGTFTRTDGSTGIMADLSLDEQAIYRQFTDPVAISDEAAALPDLLGGGAVRDLREGMSLDSSGELTILVDQFVGASTRAEQTALVDQIIQKWMVTSDFETSPGFHYDGTGAGTSSISYLVQYGFSGVDYSSATNNVAGSMTVPAGHNAWIDRLRALEVFNGRAFVDPFNQPVSGGGTGSAGGGAGAAAPAFPTFSVGLSEEQMEFLTQSYGALQGYVYGGLVMETRLKQFGDLIGLDFDGANLALDFSAMEAAMHTGVVADPVAGLLDIIDFVEYGGGRSYGAIGWDFTGFLRTELQSTDMATVVPEVNRRLENILAGPQIVVGSAEADVLDGGLGNDFLFGDAAGDTLNGGGGMDALMGGDGNDYLYGQDGDDLLDGGAGNDTLNGGNGNDIYRFGLGDGQDTINNYDANAGSRDVLDVQGIASQDLWFTRSGNTLIVDMVGSDDQMRINNWFSGSAYQLDEISAGGETLYAAQVEQLVNAMAVFDVPSGVGAVVPQSVQDELAPTLAVSWQA